MLLSYTVIIGYMVSQFSEQVDPAWKCRSKTDSDSSGKEDKSPVERMQPFKGDAFDSPVLFPLA